MALRGILFDQIGGGGGSEPGKCSSNRDCPRWLKTNRFCHDTDILYVPGTIQSAQSMAIASVQVIGEFRELEKHLSKSMS